MGRRITEWIGVGGGREYSKSGTFSPKPRSIVHETGKEKTPEETEAEAE